MNTLLQEVVKKHEAEVAKFRASHELDDSTDLFEDLFDYYCNSGEMPYSVAKGDPMMWMNVHFLSDLKQ